MKSNIFIPKKIKVGFNLRSDTYTGKLAYVIYHDGKVWRKEPSWEGWRAKYMDEAELEERDRKAYEVHKTQWANQLAQNQKYYKDNPKQNSYYMRYENMTNETFFKECRASTFEDYRKSGYCNIGNVSGDKGVIPLELTNEPIDGFVLNKKVGGDRYGWNPRQTYCRVYDPRGFEFEITIPNLLYILENANSIKGKGLEGKFIYGWEGKDLILVPEEAPEYKQMVIFTQLQDLKISKKDLKLGGMYMDSNGQKVTYLGEHYMYSYDGTQSTDKKLWFYGDVGAGYFDTKTVSCIKKYTGEDNQDIANILDKLEKQTSYKPKKIMNVSYKELEYSDIQNSFTSNYSEGRYQAFIPAKTKGTYKSIVIKGGKHVYNQEKRDYDSRYWIQKGWRGKPITLLYPTLQELIKENKIYKQVKQLQNGN